MTRLLCAALIALSFVAIPQLVGCDRNDATPAPAKQPTAEHDVTVQKPDGTVVKEQQKTTETPSGTTETKTEKKVEKP